MPHMGGEWIPGGLKTHAAGSILGFAWFSELVGAVHLHVNFGGVYCSWYTRVWLCGPRKVFEALAASWWGLEQGTSHFLFKPWHAP